ncbi:MAG: ROK family protein [Oscillospiraceae bacterium]|jgi:glucokinase|nr:ROK family protein [Oscillospiraceae bacterium]
MKYLGIDLGATNIAVGVVDEDFSVISRLTCKTAIPRAEEKICDDMARLTKQALSLVNATLDDIPWIGIGCPGSVNIETGIVEYSANLFFHNWNLAEMMKERLFKQIFLENDANTAAYGEHIAGATKGSKTSITITVGTGIGSGIIIDDKLYSGCNFTGGELGHTVIISNGLPCACGRKGCWEVYASSRGLVAIVRENLDRDIEKKSCMWEMIENNHNKISGRMPFLAMKKGDILAKVALDQYLEYLSCGIVNAINLFQPEIFCVGGGISREGETLLGPIRKYVEENRYSKHSKKQTEVRKAELGDDSGIIGAAFLGNFY